MKTLLIVVVLSFTSVCWSAPLACNDLLREVTQSPDLSGRWYTVAMSTDSCILTALMKFLNPSVRADYTMEAPNVYNLLVTANFYGYCANDTKKILQDNSRLVFSDQSTQDTNVGQFLLKTSCPDCIVVKMVDNMSILVLLSRRKNVNSDELSEFFKQAECAKYNSPVVSNTNYAYENCKYLDSGNEDLDPAVEAILTEKLEEFGKALADCIKAYLTSLYESITNIWS